VIPIGWLPTGIALTTLFVTPLITCTSFDSRLNSSNDGVGRPTYDRYRT
jgi:hypothetical protein